MKYFLIINFIVFLVCLSISRKIIEKIIEKIELKSYKYIDFLIIYFYILGFYEFINNLLKQNFIISPLFLISIASLYFHYKYIKKASK